MYKFYYKHVKIDVMENNFDTIVAIATPLALGAIGIIRISGDKSFLIAQKMFSKKIKPKRINYGHILDKNKKIIDEVIVLPFSSPHSYTGEDVVEIQSHGSPVILNEIMELVLEYGARPAQKGEFTKRAFLNHRIDLTQAEAVIDIIEAKNTKSASFALNNLEGVLKDKIKSIRISLFELYSRVIASVDFPEDVAEVDNKEVVSICSDNIQIIENILEASKNHNFIKDGISSALIGVPNIGKSSLFNALLNYERAIVTPIEGTTRDTIKETINIGGYSLNIIDTAGIRDKNKADTVEKIGIENSINAIEHSQIILFLVENSLDEIDKTLLDKAKNKKIIFVQTKADINTKICDRAIKVSAINGFGLDELKGVLLSSIKELVGEETDYTTNKRHQNCLKRAKEYAKKELT